MNRFLITLSATAFLAAAGTYLLAYVVNFGLPSLLWPTLIFTAFCTALMFRRVFNSERTRFATTYLLTIVIKLLVSLGYAGLIIFLDPAGYIGNVLFFLFLYITFTIIEVIYLFKVINR